MYQDAFDALANLGLKRDEAKVYIACLRNKGGLFTHEITHLSGVKRSTVDIIIRRLIAKNFLSSFREGQRRKFAAEPPETILFDYQRGLEDFRGFIPMLMRLSTNTEQTRVTFHEGAKGVKAVFDDIILTLKQLPEKERVVCCVSSGRDVEKIQPRFRQQFIDRRIQSRIHVQMIAVRNVPEQTWASSQKDLRVTKMFDGKKYPFDIEVDIVEDKIMFISAYKPVGGVTIQNKTIARSIRSLFYLLWDLLGEPEPDLDGLIAESRQPKRGKSKTLDRPRG